MKKFLLFAFLALVSAESGIDGWLRYAPIPSAKDHRDHVPSSITVLNSTTTSPVYVAGTELQKGISGVLDKQTTVSYDSQNISNSAIVGTIDDYVRSFGNATDIPELEEDGFWLSVNGTSVQIVGQNERGALYGAFEYLSMIAQENFSQVAYASNPSAPIRWTNEWDNMDGSIERGYGGASLFFNNGLVNQNLTRASQYARLLASIGINGVVVNNVNANATTLSAENIRGLGRIADVFRPYGVKLGLSLNFASPQTLGGLDSFDPLDPTVISWWGNVTDQIYEQVPDMAGYLVKANSEGQPGPLTYNRTLADGANLFARAAGAHGGIVMFRAFVYDNTINETNWTNDRANAAVDFFRDLDGKFEDNVVVQVKYGPIDFQVREPTSPLFAHLRNTNAAIELQTSPEYLGQNSHLLYLPPLWKTVLDFDLRADSEPSVVSDIVSGKRFNRRLGGYAGVTGVGMNTTWVGSHLALSNLYTFGRLAWDPSSDLVTMLQDWIRLTFGCDQEVIDTLTKMSMESWPAYEGYSGNLGIQTLTDIIYTHFGPNPASQDGNGWGQWTRADGFSIGMDRTVSNGTGNTGQYPTEVGEMYENIETTPDNLLLWFHHVNYTHVLKSGKTVIQHFYDAHYNGSETAQTFVPMLASLEGKIDSERFEQMLFQQTYQAGHSIVWRDAINDFYHNLSGIPDEADRVGNHPFRIEAEDMILTNYQSYAVNPFETASNTTAVITTSNSTTGTAMAELNFESGTYDIAVNYYDLYGGKTQWELSVNNSTIASWKGDNEGHLGHTPSIYLDGHSATRKTFHSVRIRKGDMLKVTGVADGVEPAPLDYVAIVPPGEID